ncbi:hypothetical protein DKT74_09600, partial [Streptomyces sp. ZEA17I]
MRCLGATRCRRVAGVPRWGARERPSRGRNRNVWQRTFADDCARGPRPPRWRRPPWRRSRLPRRPRPRWPKG